MMRKLFDDLIVMHIPHSVSLKADYTLYNDIALSVGLHNAYPNLQFLATIQIVDSEPKDTIANNLILLWISLYNLMHMNY